MSLFNEGAYDELEFHFPTAGMNQNISPRLLPPKFAYVLENIISLPLGRGTVRNGTKLLNADLPFDSTIMEIFPVVEDDGFEHMILYVNDFKVDDNITNFLFISEKSVSFDTTTPQFYQKDTTVKIIYSGENFINETLRVNIDDVSINVNHVFLTFKDNVFIPPVNELDIVSTSYSIGNLYAYYVQINQLSDVLNETPLSVACIPRHLAINNTILIYNGVDRLMSWDGNDLKIVTDYVNEYTANSFNRIGNSSFSFVVDVNSFVLSKYQNNANIILRVNNVPTSLVVSNVVLNVNVVTITTSTPDVPAFTGVDAVTVSYGDYPPPFNFLFSAHNRIWALGPGAAGINYRAPAEALRIYLTDQPDSFTSWFNEQTKSIRSADLSDKHGIVDNFEAICSIGGYLAFIGRYKTQIWQGSNPTPNATPLNQFLWAYNISVGIVHGNLLIDVANDTNLITSEGDKISLSRFNISQQIGATAEEAINPIISEYLGSTLDSNIEYRKCRSFKYKNGPFCGFKIGSHKVLLSLYSTSLYSWSFFSGDFQNASAIVAGSYNSLYLGIGNKIYKYADGKDGGEVLYGDTNGSSLIQFWWTLPIVYKGGRFANKRYAIDMQYSSAFARKNTNKLSIGIYGDLRKTFTLSNDYKVPDMGDRLNTVPLLPVSADPNFPLPTDPGMRLDTPYATLIGRLKFISSSFWLYLSGYALDGPIIFDKIRLFGIKERKS